MRDRRSRPIESPEVMKSKASNNRGKRNIHLGIKIDRTTKRWLEGMAKLQDRRVSSIIRQLLLKAEEAHPIK